ncbi:MAG: Nucleotide sugar dehydrogenase [Candidatus Daviesbacteria bacterium GW2011_GWA1_41_61]|uniref:UDP-glucose 6-dehydrogenase n=1 Tax=Candidatus Daviesbacteria bacterium GW2011_GWA2_40_9 TaxID=1618424 RepID=A0A0G0TZN9_9BACT|nr:MAG: UDP-glucose 6-dehydrogenase, UDPglucose 6-dehydrogenase [Candidatus Daviesbacteria bacterium GW2011_GWC1_40_9]KKR82303.1 MAG: Nucleotide sugar dehydrogenase [Candidatus Daviesbacteria bacterium GW2011_GWA2_40_9]KKR93054.1 MAG: Nucleotide sugar dehydrogenase [Candidatus Daviesbacteria bacterium GW2011_GWB1_41_15]KKS15598.1 MAG: Nucleotide sugar dehydrogenase [Candidatus Daviesbacteria bacterium GW2011_GWA1_41_61]
MIISIVGTGYVGLVTGAIFADLGHKVFCIDIDRQKIKALSQGDLPFFEPGLEELVKRNIIQKRLFFTNDYSLSVPKSKVVFICVGTPANLDGEADLSYLFSAVTQAANHLKGYTLIAIKSTVPIGVEKELEKLISQKASTRYEFASCPEFLREGSAVEDAQNPDRIVIGTKSKKAADLLLDLYKHMNGQRIICDLRSAQMIKYAANSFLATKISFANAVANLCEATQADAEVVLQGVGSDKRIGRAFLYPGVGYGGSCFPKDISAFISLGKRYNYNFDLLKAVNSINSQQIDFFVEKVEKALGNLKGKQLAVLGISFKPNTDDIREAPSIKIIHSLLEKGAEIKAYDPVSVNNARRVLPKEVIFDHDPYTALTDCQALLLITEWNEFKELDLEKVKRLMKKPVIIDGRNIYDPAKVKQLGFIYQGIGRS